MWPSKSAIYKLAKYHNTEFLLYLGSVQQVRQFIFGFQVATHQSMFLMGHPETGLILDILSMDFKIELQTTWFSKIFP